MGTLLWLVTLTWAAPLEAPTEPAELTEPDDPLTELREVYGAVERFEAIEAEWRQGVVRLSGEVPSVEARAVAQGLASKVEGARFVDNLLDVASEPPPSEAMVTEDDAIRERLQGVFREIESLEEITVEVRSGVVALRGLVASNDAHERAVGLAERQEGVVFVDDQLEELTNVSARLTPAVQGAWEQVQALVAQGPLLIISGVILVLFLILAGALRRWDLLYRRLNDRPLLRATVGRVVWGATAAAGLLIALEILDATALVGALVGTAGVFGLALGFAFQDIVENYLAGLMLSVQQPFSKDDLVEIEGILGIVMRLTPRNTLIMTVEGNHVFVPNATVFKGEVTNYSRNPFRRFDFQVGVGVDEDLTVVIDTGMATLQALDGVTREPPPFLRIEALGDSSVVIGVYAWVDQRVHDYGAVRTETIRRVKEAFDDAGFDMPEPIYRVSMSQAPAKKAAHKPATHRHESTASAVNLERVDVVERQARDQGAAEEGTDLLAPRGAEESGVSKG